MVRFWHIVLVSLLALQCSPLCSCALAQMIAGTSSPSEIGAAQQAASNIAAKMPTCPTDRSDSRENSCFCVATAKAATAPADKAESFSGELFQSTILVADCALSPVHSKPIQSAEPPDPFASQSLPRLN